MKVLTYYSPCAGLPPQGGVLERWVNSWAKAGYDPVVLNRSHAEQHPRYSELLQVFKAYPTINPAEYELACYLRWLALDAVGGGLMSDYDVMNVSLFPADIAKTDVLFYERRRVPCLVQTSEAGSKKLVEHLVHTKPPAGLHHWSDMVSLMKSDWLAVDHCTEIGDAGWDVSKTIHFAHGACKKYRPSKSKHAIIDEVLKGRK